MGKRGLCTSCAVVLTAAFGLVGPAQAGNGNGNGNANGKSDAAPAEQPAVAPGSSADAPGHNKQDGDAQAAPEQKGPDKKDSAPAQTSAPTPAPSEGVKPSNSTAKNTNAPAGSNKTKVYGNGKTAGQIAIEHGYPASGNVYGPGNSQPHKVVTCGHRHGVDVHALKSHPAKGCGSSPTPPTHNPDPPTVNEPPVVTPHGSTSVPGSKPVDDPVKDPAKKKGAQAKKSAASVEAVSGVLAATGAFAGSSLPFTGFPLWAVALVALTVIGAGLSLRRVA